MPRPWRKVIDSRFLTVRSAAVPGLSVLTFMAVLGLAAMSSRGNDAQTSKSQAGTLEERFKAVLETPAYRAGHWGILVVDASTGRSVYEHNSDQFFAPASVAKLFSVAAALVELGADHRFETPVVRRGEVDPEGTLHGDLILIAQGDLSMGGRTGADGALLFKDDDHTYAGGNPRSDIVGDPLAGLDHLAREVRAGRHQAGRRRGDRRRSPLRFRREHRQRSAAAQPDHHQRQRNGRDRRGGQGCR